ncbi:TonB-dependent receptor [Dasania marina]|uniref:TonB-dependent receptor n=1 Tax=Dasania marina TaxID=471499 RepID=UPI0030DD6946|tara:strand:+ start:139009 stop:141270 length:2262 start_codon:yes stop_codon:yes gene_type:complete
MNNTVFSKSNISRVIAIAAALTSGSAAIAEGNIRLLEEIIVTSQKTEAMLQDVPLAVTAFDATALTNAGIQDMTEIAKSVPNVTLSASRGTNTTLTAFVRGIGQADPVWGFEPGVGMYIDDIYMARPQGGVLDVFDVERIEVLRGPQGTLFGKNTIGGAINYISKRMTGQPEMSAEVTVGSYGQQDVKVAGQYPIIEDKLFVGLTVAKYDRDGYGEFLQSGDENYNKDLLAARFNLEYIVNDDIDIRVSIDDTQDDSNAKGGHRLTPSVFLPGEAAPSDVFDSNADMSTDNEVTASGGSVIVNWHINSDLALKSITAYREGDTVTNIDFDNTSFASAHVPAVYNDDQTSQEIQLAYSSEKLEVVGGLYYFTGTASGAFDVLLGGFDAFFGTAGNFSATSAGSVDTTSYAAFVNSNFTLNDAWSLTLGARYTIEEKDADVYKAFLDVETRSNFTGGTTNSVIGAPATDYSNDESWSEFTPKVGAEYRLNEDEMVYASFSQGFKSGGFDIRGDAAANPNTVNGFDPEYVDTYEFGYKAELMDGRIRLNAALFYSDYTDMQVTIQESSNGGANYVASVLNAGESTIQGFELEVMAQLTENLSTSFMYGYVDAEYDEVLTQVPDAFGNPSTIDLADSWNFADTPEQVARLSFSYNLDLDNKGRMVMTTSASYSDERQIFVTESPIDEDSYTLVDASAVWYSMDEHWTVGLHAKNITDEEYRTGGYNFPIPGGLGGEDVIIGYYGNPRTVSLNVGYNY